MTLYSPASKSRHHPKVELPPTRMLSTKRDVAALRHHITLAIFNTVFSANLLVAIDWDGDIMRDLGQKMATSNLRRYTLAY